MLEEFRSTYAPVEALPLSVLEIHGCPWHSRSILCVFQFGHWWNRCKYMQITCDTMIPSLHYAHRSLYKYVQMNMYYHKHVMTFAASNQLTSVPRQCHVISCFLLSESVGGRSLWAPATSRRLVVCLCRWGCVHGWGRGVTDCEGSWHNDDEL